MKLRWMKEMLVYYFNILNLALLKTSFQGNSSPSKSPSVPCLNKWRFDQSLSSSADTAVGSSQEVRGHWEPCNWWKVTPARWFCHHKMISKKWLLSWNFRELYTVSRCKDRLRSFRPKTLFTLHLLWGSTKKYSLSANMALWCARWVPYF